MLCPFDSPKGDPTRPFDLARAKNSVECPLNPPDGMKNCEFEDRLVQAFGKEAANLPEYNFLGPNSNTFAHNIILGAGGSVPSPPQNAPGWGWTHQNRNHDKSNIESILIALGLPHCLFCVLGNAGHILGNIWAER